MTYMYNNQEMTAREIKRLNPNISYKDPTQLGAIPILPTAKPECEELERATRDGVEVVDGNTVQKWKVVDMFSDYFNDEGIAVTKTEQEAEYLTKKMKDKAKAAEQAVQSHINTTVKGIGYDDENSIAKYLVDTNPFYAECVRISLWIGSVWVSVHTIQADVLAGNIPEPTEEELIAMLPEYV